MKAAAQRERACEGMWNGCLVRSMALYFLNAVLLTKHATTQAGLGSLEQ